MKKSNATIETFMGRLFDILHPEPEMVCIEDIAHSLSQLPRYTGHCKFPYPVAQHLRVGSYFTPSEFAYDYFCHDFSEAYLNDMSRPLKHFTKAGKEYRKVERRVQAVIAEAFGFARQEPPIVKLIDTRMLYTEKIQLMSSGKFHHEWTNSKAGREPLPVTLEYADFWKQKKMFLKRFNELKRKIMITNIITQIAGQQNPQSVTLIIKCDRPGCDKEITFDSQQRAQALLDNPWLRAYRTVTAGDGRPFGYCGDVCEVLAVETGIHNIPEPPKIVPAANAAAVAAAAQAAENAKASDANLRSGAGGKIQITD